MSKTNSQPTTAFATWLRTHFTRGANQINRAEFLRLARMAGYTISPPQINHWIYGRPLPPWWPDAQQRIETLLAQPAAAHVYLVALPVTAEERSRIEAVAATAECSTDIYLQHTLRAAIEEDCNLT